MSEQNSSSSGGIGFVGLLTIMLIGLKLTGFIDWSWWWIWSPVWIAVLAIVVFIVLGLAGIMLREAWKERNQAKRRTTAR